MILKVINEKLQIDIVKIGRRRKFNNFFRNRKFFFKSFDFEDNVNKNENIEGNVVDYLNGLKLKVIENINVLGKNN